MGGDSSAKGLPERNDRLAVDASCVYKVFVGRLGIAIDSGFARLSFAAPVTAVFQGKNIYVRAVEKFVGRRAVGDVGSITVESENCKSCLIFRDPPRVEFDSVGGCQPNVFNIETSRMPVALKAAGIVWEEDQV